MATAGGTLVQHLFRRTGEQLKEVTAQTRPRTRVGGRGEAGRDGPPPLGVYGEPTTHGTTVRGWKRSLLGAGAVFLIAMAAITGIEAFSGGPVSNVWGGDSGAPRSVTASTPPPRTPARAVRPRRVPPSGDGGTGPSGEGTAPSAGAPIRPATVRVTPAAPRARPGAAATAAEAVRAAGPRAPDPGADPSGGDTAPSGQEDQGERRDQRGRTPPSRERPQSPSTRRR
ncbi:hypothetical protein NKH77_38460 [Streptomyces sp. M19]